MNPGRGSLGYLIWLFIFCIFYLLPVIYLEKYISGWAWPAGIAFWGLIAVILTMTGRYLTRRTK